MYALTAEITIAGKTFRRISEVEIVKSAQVLEDTATITMPATARLVRAGEFISEVETAKTFKVGDPVTIRLGYNGELRDEFEGYVRRIKPTIPLQIECQDATWLLRRKNLKVSLKNTNLRKLLEIIVEGTGISIDGEVPGIQFSTFYFRNVTAATALQKLKDEYGLTIYLRTPNKLHVGLRNENDGKVVKYRNGVNVIEDNLEWIDPDDTRLKIKAIHWRRNNTKIEKEVGDADGELRTLHFYNIADEKQLEALAMEEIQQYKYAGYKGGLTGFLLPLVEVGNVVQFDSVDFPERSGRHLVEKITTSFGTNGARRKVEIGIKVT